MRVVLYVLMVALFFAGAAIRRLPFVKPKKYDYTDYEPPYETYGERNFRASMWGLLWASPIIIILLAIPA